MMRSEKRKSFLCREPIDRVVVSASMDIQDTSCHDLFPQVILMILISFSISFFFLLVIVSLFNQFWLSQYPSDTFTLPSLTTFRRIFLLTFLFSHDCWCWSFWWRWVVSHRFRSWQLIPLFPEEETDDFVYRFENGQNWGSNVNLTVQFSGRNDKKSMSQKGEGSLDQELLHNLPSSWEGFPKGLPWL